MGQYDNEISRRRTFAIISHPDAGKTTLTEKFLLYGGAINTAGSVKGRKTQKHAVSDWMEIEKQRGISVTSSVLQFNYDGYCINLLDTPGHQDFSEDTYRTLMAADSAVMVIDGAKGVEPQTIKLFKVCVLRHIPIFTFVNKMDREINDPFSLLDEIENVLGIHTCPVTWPIGSGKTFQGVYDRQTKNITKFYAKDAGQHELATSVVPLADLEDAEKIIGEVPAEKLREDMELLDGASEEFDQEKVTKGLQTPVFFGSALTNFGVGNFLDHFLQMTYPPMARESDEGTVTPYDDHFSAFVFKIQANMNKAHRDRIAFIRVVSGKFTAGMEVFHVQGNRNLRLTQPQQMMAEERKIIDEAYAGDIIGIFDPGIFHIGDTLVDTGEHFRFGSIPTFAPDHFARVKQTDTMKRKQFTKGIEQIALEGAVQIFKELDAGAAVRRFKIPHGFRISRGDRHRHAPLRAYPLDRKPRGDRPQSRAGHFRHETHRRSQGQSAPPLREPLVRPHGRRAEPEAPAFRVRQHGRVQVKRLTRAPRKFYNILSGNSFHASQKTEVCHEMSVLRL